MQRCSVDAHVNFVNETWSNSSLNRCISNIFIRLEKVICLVNEGDGGNDLVETKRGIKHSDMTFDFDLNSRNHMTNNINKTIRLTVTDKFNVISEENIGDDDDVIRFEANI